MTTSTDIDNSTGKELIQFIDRQLTMRGDQLLGLLAGSGISSDKFRYMAVQQLVRKPELADMTRKNPGSFVASVMQAAEQGLDFSKPNEAHLIPMPGKNEGIVLFRGYKGIAKMAKRSPTVADIDMQPVYSNDVYKRKMGSARSLVHEAPPFGNDRGKLIGFYAIAYLRGAPPLFDEMTVEEVEQHAKQFIKSSSGPFSKIKTQGSKAENFIAYGLKTILIRLCYRKLDLSSELGIALQEEFEAEESANTESPKDSTAEVHDAEFVDLADKVAAKREELKKQTAATTTPTEQTKSSVDWNYKIEGKDSPYRGWTLQQLNDQVGLGNAELETDGLAESDMWVIAATRKELEQNGN